MPVFFTGKMEIRVPTSSIVVRLKRGRCILTPHNTVSRENIGSIIKQMLFFNYFIHFIYWASRKLH